MDPNPNSYSNQHHHQYGHQPGNMIPNPLIPGNPNYGQVITPHQSTHHYQSSSPTNQIHENKYTTEENKFNIETGETSLKIQLEENHSTEKTIHKKHYETSMKFRQKKQVYDKVMAALKDHDKAILYSNIWYNQAIMGNKYSKQIQDVIELYKPDE